MNKQKIKEGKAVIEIYHDDKISKELPVFYNPVMKLNRDMSVVFLLAWNKKMRIADIMAGSGVRSICFAKELGALAQEIHINDASKEAISLVKKNMGLSTLQKKKIRVSNEDANLFMMRSKGFDYIDIDPFGSPVGFLDSACRRLSREGILAITATDTAPLCGTYPKTCIRRYWAMPKKCGMMHEIGLRILARRVQLIGAQYDRALVPVISYSTDHYFRIFFANRKGKNEVDKIMKQLSTLDGAGPMWLGPLWDAQMVKNMTVMAKKRGYMDILSLLEIIEQESRVQAAGFYDIHEVCSQLKTSIPRKDQLIAAIKKAGYDASNTHFKGEGIRSTIPKEKLIEILKKSENLKT